MIVGSVSTANARQIGHCRSPYSTSLTGAPGFPSTVPCWGMPDSSKLVNSAPASGFDDEPEPDPATLTPIRIPATTTATTVPARRARIAVSGRRDRPTGSALPFGRRLGARIDGLVAMSTTLCRGEPGSIRAAPDHG